VLKDGVSIGRSMFEFDGTTKTIRVVNSNSSGVYSVFVSVIIDGIQDELFKAVQVTISSKVDLNKIITPAPSFYREEYLKEITFY
jgi:hypothetical protein